MQSQPLEKKLSIRKTKSHEALDINNLPLVLQPLNKKIDLLLIDLDKTFIDKNLILSKVFEGLHQDISEIEIYNLAAETSAYMNLIHPNYSLLAGRIIVSFLHNQTKSSFTETIIDLYNVKSNTGQLSPVISDDVYNIIIKNSEAINKEINYERDYTFDYFAFKTLEKSYLLKISGKIVERPQHLFMRTAIGIHKEDLISAFETYHLMSNKWFIHATPTLFQAGTTNPQLSSCFILTMKEDSIEGIYETLKQCAIISKDGGGIGLSIHDIGARNNYINSAQGTSKGIIPMLKVFNETMRYIDQGGKRKGAFAIYIEPWHSDIIDYLDLKKSYGKEEYRARDLFYALWIPDLFMQRVENDDQWTLLNPSECPGLSDVWGHEFNKLYIKYEQEGKGKKVIKARDLWSEIVESQIETGTPFMLYKDSVNFKSNQKNLGTIKSSNLCTEIMEYTSKDEIAVCNLASISLSKFVDPIERKFDLEKLYDITCVVTRNLNRIIDTTKYPLAEAKKSNLRHRPLGIGVQGLADAFLLMKFAFESPEAAKLNEQIFETIYFAALTTSKNLAKVEGPYESFIGSPGSKGLLQFDLWNVEPSNRYDWKNLKQEIIKYGTRNSLLVALMPTASTSQILGNNEGFEPYTSNIYIRRVLAGEFICVNPHLVKDLIELNLWTPQIRNKLLALNGSIQNISMIPYTIKELYKTVWEIKQRTIIDLAAGRGPYIDQSQSMTLHISEPNYSKICSMHFYAWKKGLKTGMYYFRCRPAVDAIKFTVDYENLMKDTENADNYQKNKEIIENIFTNSSTQRKKQEKMINEDNMEMCFSCGS